MSAPAGRLVVGWVVGCVVTLIYFAVIVTGMVVVSHFVAKYW